MRRWAQLADRVAPKLAHVMLAAIALTEGARSRWRRFRGKPPRAIWGPSAILSIKYWSASLRSVGYESATAVDVTSAITEKSDFDAHRDDLIESSRLPRSLRQYAFFIWALRRGDVFMGFFDGGFLRSTPLFWEEYGLMRLAGKKLVVSAYGGDIAVPGYLGELEEPVFADYPQLAEWGDEISGRVLHALEHAELSILNIQPGFQPSHNVVWANQLGIDAERWDGAGRDSGADGRSGPVSVVHAPNHREIKGTAFLERAVAELRDEGLQINLRILEGVPNETVRSTMLATDIVADQFLFGYGQFAVEGMAAGKPVLCNLTVPPAFTTAKQIVDCPIVDTEPGTLKEDLRRLVDDPALRRELGAAGRHFTTEWHSYETVGGNWAAIVDAAWSGASLPHHLSEG